MRPYGGLIGKYGVSSTSSTTGIWTSTEQSSLKAGRIWPSIIRPSYSVEYVVVAGGGGGGHGGGRAGGGGGAGGIS